MTNCFSLVFTQFRLMARIIGLMLKRENIQHVYFAGGMNDKQRTQSIESFHSNRKIKVMIAILKSGGVGLNLRSAHANWEKVSSPRSQS